MNNDLAQFSEERLKQMVKFCETSIHGLPKHFEASEVAALARIALAAKQAKPVGYIAEVSGNRVGVLRGLPMPEIGSLIYTTTQPARTEQDDTRRMDWLVSKYVAVRTPLPYGSHEMFVAQCDSDDHEEYHTTLREQIDKACAAAPKPESE